MFHPSEAQHGNLDNIGCGKGNDFQSPFRDSCKSSPMALPEDIQYICLGKGKTLLAKFWKVSGCNHLNQRVNQLKVWSVFSPFLAEKKWAPQMHICFFRKIQRIFYHLGLPTCKKNSVNNFVIAMWLENFNTQTYGLQAIYITPQYVFEFSTRADLLSVTEVRTVRSPLVLAKWKG